MKMKEIKLKTDAELETMLRELEAEVATGSFSRIFGRTKDTSAAKKAKRTIARILTLKNDKKRAATPVKK
ncbi:MAG: 50S ribosomal protein L29 [bacterium]